MRPRTLLVLFVVVGGLAAFVGLYERKLPGSDERAKQGKKLFDLKKDQVTAITIASGGTGEVHLERVGKPAAKPAADGSGGSGLGAEPGAPAPPDDGPPGVWKMTRPLAASADGLAVDGLAESLAGLAKERTIDHPDPRALGLDHPQLTVRLATDEGEKVLSFGAKVPTSGEVMVSVGGDAAAYAVPDSVLSNLQRDPGEWRDKQIFHGDRERIDRVAVSGPAGEVVLVRRGADFWIESPAALRDRADRDLVEALLTDLTTLRADRFVDGPAAGPAAPPTAQEMGLAPPRGAVEAALRGEARPFRLEVGGAAAAAPAAPPAPGAPGSPPPAASPSIYARSGDAVFTAPAGGLAAALGRGADAWRSKALSGLQVYQVDSARVTDGAGTVELTRSGTDWRRGSVTIPYTPVSDLLFAVTGAKAIRLVSAAEAKQLGAPLDRPLLSIALKAAKDQGGKDQVPAGASGTASETLTLYPAVAAGVPARAGGRDAVLLLPADQLAGIEKQIAAVRAAPPVPPSSAPAAASKK